MFNSDYICDIRKVIGKINLVFNLNENNLIEVFRKYLF